MANNDPDGHRHCGASSASRQERSRSILAQIARLAGSGNPGEAAARLIEEFGSASAALAGSYQRQLRSTGDARTVDLLRRARTAMLHLLAEDVAARPVIPNWATLIRYLQTDLAHRTTEQFRVIHLNGRNELIRDDVMADGTLDQAAVYVREIIARALELGSASIVLVHNHPSGDPDPSGSDKTLTRTVDRAAAAVDLALLDHIIIGNARHTSFRSLGLL